MTLFVYLSDWGDDGWTNDGHVGSSGGGSDSESDADAAALISKGHSDIEGH